MKEEIDIKLLKEKREELGHTQHEAAEIIGVDPMSLSRWERGKCRPRNKKISASLQRYLKR